MDRDRFTSKRNIFVLVMFDFHVIGTEWISYLSNLQSSADFMTQNTFRSSESNKEWMMVIIQSNSYTFTCLTEQPEAQSDRSRVRHKNARDRNVKVCILFLMSFAYYRRWWEATYMIHMTQQKDIY
jgi:hypothetical protein